LTWEERKINGHHEIAWKDRREKSKSETGEYIDGKSMVDVG